MKKPNILIIGEEDFVMDLQSKFWESEYEIFGAKSYRIALQRIKEIEFKIVIIQDNYSEINTFDFCKQLKSFTRHNYHILVVLELKNSDLIDEYIKFGADDFISVKIDINEIKLRIKSHLKMINAIKKTIESNKRKAVAHAIKDQMRLLKISDEKHEEMSAGQYLKNVFSQIECGVFILDIKSRIVMQNKQSINFFGKKTGLEVEKFLNSKEFNLITEKFNLDRLSETNITLDYGVRTYNFTIFPLREQTKNIDKILFIEDVSE
ncbi:MAG: response regulator [Candidatus Cloacimonadota bacterium]|nr:response regulator [Candidatus Cloacimonadota bacterium]